MEELIAMILDWVGLDLKSMSWPKRILVVALHTAVGLTLTLSGLYFLITNFDTAAIMIGGLCAVFGTLYLARVAINLLAVLRE